MTTLSPHTRVASPVLNDKGSIYGKAKRFASPHSFQQSTRSGQSVCADRTNVLSKEATLFSLYSQSIITSGQTRYPTITRDS